MATETSTERGRRWREQNPGRQAANRRRHYAANRQDYLDAARLRTTGCPPEIYHAAREAQNDLCAICGRPETRQRKTGTPLSLSMDHDHETGAWRGLLCHDCNRGIGYFADDPARLRAAAEYIERYGLDT